jgi:type I restriction enzyme S subunit
MSQWPTVTFGEILRPNKRPYNLGPTEDADLVGMRLYGEGPFHRERKPALQIKKKSHFVIRANDVIYNKLFAWKGTFGVVPPELDGMFVSDKFPTYEADHSRLDIAFLRWYFRYPPLWDQAKDYSKGAAALSKLTLNPPDFPKLTIPLPPLTEQRRLVERIDALAATIAEAKRLRDELREETESFLPAFLGE